MTRNEQLKEIAECNADAARDRGDGQYETQERADDAFYTNALDTARERCGELSTQDRHWVWQCWVSFRNGRHE